MTIQPYHRRLRLVPSDTPEGRKIAETIKHQQRAKPETASRTVRKVSRWHTT